MPDMRQVVTEAHFTAGETTHRSPVLVSGHDVPKRRLNLPGQRQLLVLLGRLAVAGRDLLGISLTSSMADNRGCIRVAKETTAHRRSRTD